MRGEERLVLMVHPCRAGRLPETPPGLFLTAPMTGTA